MKNNPCPKTKKFPLGQYRQNVKEKLSLYIKWGKPDVTANKGHDRFCGRFTGAHYCIPSFLANLQDNLNYLL